MQIDTCRSISIIKCIEQNVYSESNKISRLQDVVTASLMLGCRSALESILSQEAGLSQEHFFHFEEICTGSLASAVGLCRKLP